jgi:hypothetical protein
MFTNMQERHAQGWSAILRYSNSDKFIKAAFIYPKNSSVDFVEFRPQCPNIDIMQCHGALISILCIIILLKQEFLSFYLPRLLTGHMQALQTANHVAPFSCSSGSFKSSLHDGLTGNTARTMRKPVHSFPGDSCLCVKGHRPGRTGSICTARPKTAFPLFVVPYKTFGW